MGLLVVLLVANWVAAVARFQVNVPFWDHWDYSVPLFHDGDAWSLFERQHGPHRQGIASVVQSWVMKLSGWDARIDSLWVVALLTMVSLLVLRLRWLDRGCLGWSDAWLPLAVLGMVAYENVLLVPNSSHSVMPLLLLVIAALAWLRAADARRGPLAGGLAFLALFTGFGIFTAAMLGALLLAEFVRAAIERRRISAVAMGAGVLLVLAGSVLFGAGYEFNPASEGYAFPHEPWWDYLRFVMLMLGARFGVSGASVLAYGLGALVLGVVFAASVLAVRTWWRGGEDSRRAGVGLLLLGTGLGFAIFTAVGRVHLGVDSGMASRYSVLVLACWLGAATVVGARGKRWGRAGLAVLGWSMALGPWLVLAQRPVAEWPGTVGLRASEVASLEALANRRAQWVEVLHDTGDWREAERRVPRAVHPVPEASDFDHKIPWLRERKLAMFAGEIGERPWMPWWRSRPVFWLESAGGEGDRWIGERAKVLLRRGSPGFLNLRVTQVAPALGKTAPIVFALDGRETSLDWRALREGVSLPLEPGETELVLRSPLGAVELAPPRDRRLGSFFVDTLTVGEDAQFNRWSWGESGIQPLRRLEITDGFWGWENEGAFGWTRERLVIEATVLGPTFLNVHIGGRFAPVDHGPVTVSWEEGKELDLERASDGWRFAWRVPADGSTHRLVVRNPAGAISPADAGDGSDTRALAMSVHRLAAEDRPVGTVIGER